MRLRWILALTLLCLMGVVGILVVSCAYKGDVTIRTQDSFRFISPDLEPKFHSKMDNDRVTEIHHHNDDDDEPNQEGKEK